MDFLPSTRDSKYLSSSASFFTASSETLGAFEKQTSTILMLSRLPYVTKEKEELGSLILFLIFLFQSHFNLFQMQYYRNTRGKKETL